MKKYILTPNLTLLFERTTTVSVSLPSGRTIETEDAAPDVLLLTLDDTPVAMLATDGGWDMMTAEEAGTAYEAADAIKAAKRAPKF